MKNIIAICLVLSGVLGLTGSVLAQSNCNPSNNKQIDYIDIDSEGMKTINMTIHIFQDAQGGGHFCNTPTDIATITDWYETRANNFLSNVPVGVNYPSGVALFSGDSKIRVKIKEILFYQNQAWYEADPGNNHPDLDHDDLYAQAITNNSSLSNTIKNERLNILIPGREFSAAPPYGRIKYGGRSYGIQYTSRRGVFLAGVTNVLHGHQGWGNTGGHLVHEFGHGLFFHHYDFSYSNGVTPYASHGSTTPSNCDNFMMDNGGGPSMTLQQVQIMHYVLGRDTYHDSRTYSTNSSRAFVETTCGGDGGTLVISNGTTETWDYEKVVYGDISIEANATLNVLCTLRMGTGTRIHIAPGGTLNVDGGVITNFENCTQKWMGVAMYGNQWNSQIGGGIQPKVTATNATFMNAQIAIETGDMTFQSTFGGGIIDAENTLFFNNNTHVSMTDFTHTFMGNTIDNISSFRECRFVNDANFTWDGWFDRTGVYLRDVNGIKFWGCTFDASHFAGTYNGLTSIDASFNVQDYCTNLSVSPCPAGNLIHSNFWGYDAGIYASATSNLRSFLVDGATFYHNTDGIIVQGVSDMIITRNRFQMESDPWGNFNKGIQMAGCNNYEIEENDFYSNLAATGQVGIHISGSHPGHSDNEIYNNTFDNLNFGIVVDGTNGPVYDPNEPQPLFPGGLEIRCNEFTHNTQQLQVWFDEYEDWWEVFYIGPLDPGEPTPMLAFIPSSNLWDVFMENNSSMAAMQGTPGGANHELAGNRFHSITSGCADSYSWDADVSYAANNWLSYYHYAHHTLAGGAPHYPYEPYCYTTTPPGTFNLSPEPHQFNAESCPSMISHLEGSEPQGGGQGPDALAGAPGGSYQEVYAQFESSTHEKEDLKMMQAEVEPIKTRMNVLQRQLSHQSENGQQDEEKIEAYQNAYGSEHRVAYMSSLYGSGQTELLQAELTRTDQFPARVANYLDFLKYSSEQKITKDMSHPQWLVEYAKDSTQYGFAYARTYLQKTTGAKILSRVDVASAAAGTDATTGQGENLGENSRIEWYPNPSSGDITIDLAGTEVEALTVEIFQTNGALLFSKEYSNSKEQLDIQTKLKPGMYILKISQEGQQQISQLIIQ